MNEKNLIKLNFKKISKDNYEFIFNCGDLFTRENVSWDKDLEYCIKIFKNVEFKNIKSLKLDIKYSMPNIYDIEKMKEKKINLYRVDPKKNLYTIELLNFEREHGRLKICEDFWIGYEVIIKSLIKKIENLKEIYFHGRHFIEPENGVSFDFAENDDFMRKDCNNPNWEEEMFIDPAEDKDSLEQLILLKKEVGSNVKINFSSLSEKSEKLLKQFKITD